MRVRAPAAPMLTHSLIIATKYRQDCGLVDLTYVMVVPREILFNSSGAPAMKFVAQPIWL